MNYCTCNLFPLILKMLHNFQINSRIYSRAPRIFIRLKSRSDHCKEIEFHGLQNCPSLLKQEFQNSLSQIETKENIDEENFEMEKEERQ